MPFDWKVFNLVDVASEEKRSIISGPFGSSISSKFFIDEGIPVIRGSNLSVDIKKFNEEGFVFISREKAEELKAWALSGDIVFTAAGTLGQINIIPESSKFSEYIISNKQLRVRLNEKLVVPMFAYYWLKNKPMVSHIINQNTGSTVPLINLTILKKLPIALPRINEQKQIVNILESLDDKIELNDAINKNLEEMAQAIFKRWFVDFEFPNENGEPFKSSGGEFEESELGLIPKGWRVGTLSDLGEVVGGATPSKSKEEYYTTWGIPWITPKDMSINKNKYISRGQIDITEEGFKSSSTRIVPKGTVLFSSRAPIGYIAVSKNEVTTNQGFKSLIPFEHIGSEFLYYVLKFNTETIENRASGSTFKEISGSEMKRVPVIIPPFYVIEQFNIIVEPIGKMVEKCESESDSLIQLRDSLLPKLMSGEIRAPLKQEYSYSQMFELPMAAEKKAQYSTT
ncbi:restriction endonuclease subunit S [Paenibacillus sp. H1-7]|nr:restriction endonuclease subunit S [Paenibacillus sp. H1-7]